MATIREEQETLNRRFYKFYKKLLFVLKTGRRYIILTDDFNIEFDDFVEKYGVPSKFYNVKKVDCNKIVLVVGAPDTHIGKIIKVLFRNRKFVHQDKSHSKLIDTCFQEKENLHRVIFVFDIDDPKFNHGNPYIKKRTNKHLSLFSKNLWTYAMKQRQYLVRNRRNRSRNRRNRSRKKLKKKIPIELLTTRDIIPMSCVINDHNLLNIFLIEECEEDSSESESSSNENDNVIPKKRRNKDSNPLEPPRKKTRFVSRILDPKNTQKKCFLKILRPEGIKEVVSVYNCIDKTKLPKIRSTDMLSKAVGASKNDLIKIVRVDGKNKGVPILSARNTTHRLVI